MTNGIPSSYLDFESMLDSWSLISVTFLSAKKQMRPAVPAACDMTSEISLTTNRR